MCGLIAAVTAGTPPSQVALARGLARMMRRGPDGEGEFLEGGAYLGHRRLAILDLDPRSSQPFHSSCGRYVIVFNGEIYNFRSLREGLQARGVSLHTTSDTEVLVELFKLEGEAMLERLHGMFAFVVWDRLARRAFAARDPYGIKPLYLAELPGTVLLASQVKALRATGLVSSEPDVHAQAAFWMLGHVPEPRTWYRGVRAVPAGGCLWVAEGKVARQRIWRDVGEAFRQAGEASPLPAQEVSRRVRAALQETVRRHLVADVPVGVFLSGGIDSTALAALMAEAGARETVGVTLAFDEFAGSHEDEAPPAAAVAHHYAITHHVRKVTPREFASDLPALLDAIDQPSIDGVNSWYATKAVAEHGLKVVVSGVGGDELFQGYPSFSQLPRLHAAASVAARVPGALALGRGLGSLRARATGNSRWRHTADWARTLGGAWWLRRSLAAPEDLPGLMGRERAQEALAGFDPEAYVAQMCGPLAADPRLAISQIESMAYMRNQLLRDSDWASMAHSVELRTPLVDMHLLEQLVPCLPQLAQFPGKALLAHAPLLPLPPAVTGRRKTGFVTPMQKWVGERAAGEAGEARESGPRLSGWAEWMKTVVAAYEAG